MKELESDLERRRLAAVAAEEEANKAPHWVGVALNELSLRDDVREFGWRHLFVPAGEDREAVIAAAQELHEGGGGGIPEKQPSDGEDPPAAAADEDGEEEEEEEEKELALLSPSPGRG